MGSFISLEPTAFSLKSSLLAHGGKAICCFSSIGFFSDKVYASRKADSDSNCASCSVVSDSLQPHGLYIQSLEFSRPKYWSGWPFPSPGDLPNPGIEPKSPALQADSSPAKPSGKPQESRNGLELQEYLCPN